MTKIENLEIIKAALLEKRSVLELACSALEKEAKEEKKAIFEKLFADELVSYADVAVEMGYSGMYFKIGHKEIGSINERGYGATAKELYFNTYSTTCDSEFEFKRLMFSGWVGEKMLTDMGSIKEAFATPFTKKEELDALASEYEILTKEIKEKEYEAKKIKREEFIEKLHGEGVEWTPGKPFEFNRQWTSYQAKKVKITKTTKSGKTADLEVTYGTWDWVYDEEGNSKRVDKEDKVVTHEKIRMDYVLGNFRDQLYN